MKPTPWLAAEPHRIQYPGCESRYGDDFGVFEIPHRPTSVVLYALVSSARVGRAELGDDWAWDHVSVSLKNRCPNWPEMSFVKDIFWSEDETVMQLHVPASEHRNLHPFCLHLWRPCLIAIPRPPSDAVAVPGTLADNREYLARKIG